MRCCKPDSITRLLPGPTVGCNLLTLKGDNCATVASREGTFRSAGWRTRKYWANGRGGLLDVVLAPDFASRAASG
ncbi:hypothetical protein KCP78_03010 [Salmonella enterica subsp. enterica]|nr:hypothetical protein KCP78_03010 [Salmonella enterica subsp. enterica]